MSEWISVEERLPSVGRWVLAVVRGRGILMANTCPVANRKPDSYYWQGYGAVRISPREVTHWQPIPAPPEPRS